MDRAPRWSAAKIRGRSIVCHSKVATSSRAIAKSAETECEEQEISLIISCRAREGECFDPQAKRAVSPTASHSPKDRHQQRYGECRDGECHEQTLGALIVTDTSTTEK